MFSMFSMQYVLLLLIVCCILICCWSPDLSSREQETLQPVHVINVDIQDNHEEATLGAFLICELCQCVSVSYQGFLKCHGTRILSADVNDHI